MAVAPLLAPAGVEMRVVSQAASFTWGSWSVSWPEGFEPPDPPAEDRELGWVADLGGKEVEPFGRCFVRADAQIDATLGRSNVEDVLDAAKYRTSGEVFLETEIPFENLAGQLPYRDFDVNSLVPTRVGGRILENQLVTKVEESEDEQGNRTATTYIGGQKFQDREALRTRNREIDRVIAQERLERGDEIGAKLAASQEYEREQRDNLKRYVDRRDDEVTTSAEEDAAAKAGAALSTARTDATKKANSAQSQAESYARQQDVLKLREAKEYADEVAEGKATKEQLDEARQALTDYREQVAAKIGEQGTLTKQMKSLSQDFEDKLGANGSVTEANAKHEKLLRGIVNGTDVAELDGTQFQQHQKLVNDMQVVFNARVSDNQQAFRDLFDTQAGWNKLQEAFNKKQTGINDVYDAMWEQQQYIDLAQNYTTERNRLLVLATMPKALATVGRYSTNGVETGVPGYLFDVTGLKRKSDPDPPPFLKDTIVLIDFRLNPGGATYNVILSFRSAKGSSLAVSGAANGIAFAGVVNDVGEIVVAEQQPAKTNKRWTVAGLVYTPQLVEYHQEVLADLDAEYRAKGLRV